MVTACYQVYEADDPLAPTFVYGRHGDRGFEFQPEVMKALRQRVVQRKAS